MSVALRTLPPLLFGKEHPYGVPFTGTGDPAVVQKLSRNDLASFHHRWIRADNAEIFAVGNTSLSELKQLLETSFGLWRMTREMKGDRQRVGSGKGVYVRVTFGGIRDIKKKKKEGAGD